MIDYHLLQLCSDPAEFNRRMIHAAVTQTIDLNIVTIARMYCALGDYDFIDMIRGAFPACIEPGYNWQTINTLVFYAFVGEMQDLKDERRKKEVDNSPYRQASDDEKSLFEELAAWDAASDEALKKVEGDK